MPVVYSPTGADRRVRTNPTYQQAAPKYPSLMEQARQWFTKLRAQNAARFQQQMKQVDTGEEFGQSLIGGKRARFKGGDPRQDRRPKTNTTTGAQVINPYAGRVKYQSSVPSQFSDGDPRADRRPIIGVFNGYNPDAYVPLPWWYGQMAPEQPTGGTTGGTGGYGTLANRFGGGGYGGGGRGGTSYPSYGQRANADYIPGWLQQMVNWKV